MASKDGSLTLTEPRDPLWWGLRAEDYNLSSFGMKLSGGGAHQSKTMMFRELEALISAGASTPEEFRSAAIDENAIGKATSNTRRLTFKHLASLYGLLDQPPLTKALLKIWPSDVQGRRLQALLTALARDPLLRETAPAIMSGSMGQGLQYPWLQDALLATFPERFSENTLRSLAQKLCFIMDSMRAPERSSKETAATSDAHSSDGCLRGAYCDSLRFRGAGDLKLGMDEGLGLRARTGARRVATRGGHWFGPCPFSGRCD